MYWGLWGVMPRCLALLLAPRASASFLHFSASVAFPPDNRFCILLTGVFRGMPCKWSGFSWVLLTLSSDRSHVGPFCWGKKCHQQLLRALLPSKHSRRRWLQAALSSNKTPRNQGRLENSFFFLYKYKTSENIYPEKKMTFSILWATTHTGRAKGFRS